MPTVTDLPFRRIPNHSRLFLEYLDLAPPALAFYRHPPAISSLEKLARETIPRHTFPRREIAAILRRQNEALGGDAQTAQHIDELEKPDAVAVLTGQQVGLFTGPLYTIYKAMSAIRIAEELRARGVRTVPVFWMECEDHDLAEVTHNTVIAADSTPLRLDFGSLLFGNARDSARTVGSLKLPESIREVIAEYVAHLPGLRRQQEIRAQLESAYRPGAGLADAFGQIIVQLFRGRGLLLFNPTDREAKRLVAPVFRKALQQAPEIYARLSERKRTLELSDFHTQVNILENSTVLFLEEAGQRKALVRQGPRFALKGTDRTYDPEETLGLTEHAPERFSPNVLLRPLVQDHLFPTVAYVGGPAEVAYFAQIEVLYGLFNRPMPAIWPRSSFTLLREEIAAAMRESAVLFEDCFRGKQGIADKLLESAHIPRATVRLRALADQLDRLLEEVRPALVAVDPSLGTALGTARRKIMHHIHSLQVKFVEREARQHSNIAQTADRIVSLCYPNSNLQERELGVHYFLSQDGPTLLDVIYSMVEIEKFAHRVITLDSVRGSQFAVRS